MADEKPRIDDLTFDRIATFHEHYANNLKFEASVWDLKMIFGMLDQSQTPSVVHQQLSVNIPWIQAKLAMYFIYVNLVFHESANGAVKIPDAVLPRPIEDIFPDWESDEKLKPIIEHLKVARAQLFGL